eukprot:scaffold66041_cov21-Tisochrysis_lutea.AAC.5
MLRYVSAKASSCAHVRRKIGTALLMVIGSQFGISLAAQGKSWACLALKSSGFHILLQQSFPDCPFSCFESTCCSGKDKHDRCRGWAFRPDGEEPADPQLAFMCSDHKPPRARGSLASKKPGFTEPQGLHAGLHMQYGSVRAMWHHRNQGARLQSHPKADSINHKQSELYGCRERSAANDLSVRHALEKAWTCCLDLPGSPLPSAEPRTVA